MRQINFQLSLPNPLGFPLNIVVLIYWCIIPLVGSLPKLSSHSQRSKIHMVIWQCIDFTYLYVTMVMSHCFETLLYYCSSRYTNFFAYVFILPSEMAFKFLKVENMIIFKLCFSSHYIPIILLGWHLIFIVMNLVVCFKYTLSLLDYLIK